MRVLGIDPGYAIVGWGVVEYAGNRFAPVDFGAVCTDAGVPFEQRLDEVYTGIKEVIERTKPEVLAIEKLFYQHNQTTVIGVAEARGVILLAAAQAGLPIYEYTPMQVKQAVTGYGKAVKKQVQEMTRMLLSLPAVPKPDDTADALAMAITFCHTNGNQLNRFTRRGANAGHGGEHLKAGLLLLGGKTVQAHVVLGHTHHGVKGGFLAHAGQRPRHTGRALGIVAHAAAAEHHGIHAFFDDFSCQTVNHLKPSQFLCRPIFLCSALPSGELRHRAAAGGRNR